MRLLVTGGGGFIGAHVVRLARDAGHDVSVCDPMLTWHLQDWVKRDGSHYDAIIHCAAAVVTTAAKAAAGTAVAENLEIDAALFRWAARARPGRLVYFSSSCVYPSKLSWARPLWESDVELEDPYWPDGIYGWIKLTGEVLAAQLAADGVPVTVVRPFSVYGPGMRDGFAVSSFTSQARRRVPVIEGWGTGFQERDYIHVTDVAAATLAAIEHGVDGPVNLGTGTGTTLTELAHLCAEAAGYQPQVAFDAGKPEGVPYLVASAKRLAEFYTPKVALEDGIADMLRDGM